MTNCMFNSNPGKKRELFKAFFNFLISKDRHLTGQSNSAVPHTQAAIPPSFTSIVLNLNKVQAIRQLEFQEARLPRTLSLVKRLNTHLSNLQVYLCIFTWETYSLLEQDCSLADS